MSVLRRLALRISLFASMLICGLTLAFGSMGAYYLVLGGPDRLRAELTGQLPAERDAAGKQLPFPVIALGALGLSVGMALGIGIWKAVARKAGLSHNETGSIVT